MLVTLLVFQPLILMLANLEQLPNMPYILVTLAVLKLLKLRLVKLEQFANINPMSVTFEVLRYDNPVMEVKLVIPENHVWHEVGRALANEELNTTLVVLLAYKFHRA